MQQSNFTYPIGFDASEQLLNLHQLKDTFVQAILSLCDEEEEMRDYPPYKHLQRLYLEAHQQEHQLRSQQED